MHWVGHNCCEGFPPLCQKLSESICVGLIVGVRQVNALWIAGRSRCEDDESGGHSFRGGRRREGYGIGIHELLLTQVEKFCRRTELRSKIGEDLIVGPSFHDDELGPCGFGLIGDLLLGIGRPVCRHADTA